jgi:hypothetical protein
MAVEAKLGRAKREESARQASSHPAPSSASNLVNFARRITLHSSLGVKSAYKFDPGLDLGQFAALDRSRRGRGDSGHCGKESEVRDVRFSAWSLAVSSLVCVSTNQAQVDGTNAHERPAQSDLAAADWKKNLTIGPNGPIPAIVVDQ